MFCLFHALVSFLVLTFLFVFIFQFVYATYFFHVLKYVMKLHISAFCVSGGIRYMKAKGFQYATPGTYNTCMYFLKIFFSFSF